MANDTEASAGTDGERSTIGSDRKNKAPAPELPKETRTLRELMRAGYVGHVEGTDAGAEIDVHPPRSLGEAARWKWQFWPEADG
jgi:hypothetical protein